MEYYTMIKIFDIYIKIYIIYMCSEAIDICNMGKNSILSKMLFFYILEIYKQKTAILVSMTAIRIYI